MDNKLTQIWKQLLVILIIMSFFAAPIQAKADWSDILGIFGVGDNTSQSYDYNSTKAPERTSIMSW